MSCRFAASQTPDGPVGAAGGDPAARRGCRPTVTTSPVVTLIRRLDLAARRGIPLADGPIRRGRHEALAIRAKRDAEYLARVPSTLGDHLAGRTRPTDVSPIFAGGGDPGAVRAEMQGPRRSRCPGRTVAVWFARIRVVKREDPTFGPHPDHRQPRTVWDLPHAGTVTIRAGLRAGLGRGLLRPGGHGSSVRDRSVILARSRELWVRLATALAMSLRPCRVRIGRDPADRPRAGRNPVKSSWRSRSVSADRLLSLRAIRKPLGSRIRDSVLRPFW